MIKTNLKLLGMCLGLLAIGVACAPSANQIKKALVENPEILTEAIEAHPVEVAQSLMKISQMAEQKQREMAQKAEEAEREAEFQNPKKPMISSDRAVRGNPNAPITIVEYSDFQCPYCQRGYETVKDLEKTYKDKIKVVFKHLPLDFHKMAMPAAKRFEAIAMQSPEKAFAFHDMIFENQNALGNENFLDEAAAKVGADMEKMKADMESDKVKKAIEADMAEAEKFGISGTPGFIVGGVTLKGAYPKAEFQKIIDRLLKDKAQG